MLKPVVLLALLSAIAFTGCRPAKPLASPIPVAAIAPTPTALQSPWAQSPAPTEQPYTCGNPVALGTDIIVTTPPRRMDATTTAAVYTESAAPLVDLARRVTTAANAFQQTGNLSAARCVVFLLNNAAMTHGMDGYMPDITAWKEQGMTLRAASLAWLKVSGANAATPAQASLIDTWMEDIAHREIDYFSHASCARDGCAITGHTGVGVAISAAAIGVAAQDHGLFHWAIQQYRQTVDRIDGRGMIQWDIQGRFSLKFNLLAAAGLVQVAEFGEANGIPLYSYDNDRLQLLVHTVTRALIDPEPFQDASHGHRQSIPHRIQPWEIAWANAYNQRFPDPVIQSLLQQAGPVAADTWGNNPWEVDYGNGQRLGF